MALERVESLADSRVRLYANLKDRELAREGDLFIAEGEHLVRRLLASDFAVHSLLIADKRLEDLRPVLPGQAPVYVAPAGVVNQILGYKFHSGVMGIARRKPPLPLAQLLPPPPEPVTLVVCPQIINHDNLGALMRIAAAFGSGGFVVGPQSCDPYWRRAVRVSMGAVFRLPVLRSRDLEHDLLALRDQWQVELVASVLDPAATPLAQCPAPRHRRLALLLGSESQGLDQRWIDLCNRKVTIPMQLGTDSLNVCVAAAVFLHHFTQTAAPAALPD